MVTHIGLFVSILFTGRGYGTHRECFRKSWQVQGFFPTRNVCPGTKVILAHEYCCSHVTCQVHPPPVSFVSMRVSCSMVCPNRVRPDPIHRLATSCCSSSESTFETLPRLWIRATFGRLWKVIDSLDASQPPGLSNTRRALIPGRRQSVLLRNQLATSAKNLFAKDLLTASKLGKMRRV